MTVDSVHRLFGSARVRYFGPRPLIEDDSVRSRATTLVNLEAGCKLRKTARLSLDVFNLLNASASDIDYYYTSRLRGEPEGPAHRELCVQDVVLRDVADPLSEMVIGLIEVAPSVKHPS